MQKSFGSTRHVAVWIFLREKFFDLNGHIFGPDLQGLPLVVSKCFQNVDDVAALDPDFVCVCREPLDDCELSQPRHADGAFYPLARHGAALLLRSENQLSLKKVNWIGLRSFPNALS